MSEAELQAEEEFDLDEGFDDESEQLDEDQVSESATDTGDDLDEKTTGDDDGVQENDPARVAQRIGEKHRLMKEAERRAEAAEQRALAAEARIPKPQRPAIPQMPDQFDENFSERMALREAAQKNAHAFDMQSREQQKIAAANKQARVNADAAKFNASVETYAGRAVELGMTSEQLKEAGTMVGSYNLAPDLVNHIVNDKHGPLITQYLASAPLELEKLSGLDPVSAGALMANIKLKAAKLVKKSTGQPGPSTGIKGGGARRERGPSGAKYE